MAAWRHGGMAASRGVRGYRPGAPGASRTGWEATLPPGPVSAAVTGPLGKPPIVEKPSEPHFIDFMGLPGRVDNFKNK
jgi:hypothetical protein